MSKRKEQEPEFSLDQELKDAELRAMQFESQIQSGEYDREEDETASARRRTDLDRSKELERYRGDVNQVISRAEGRRVFWKVLAIAGPNRLSPNISDPYITAFSEGKRSVANDILRMIYDADPAAYARMQNEALSDLKAQLEAKKKEAEDAKEK